MADYGKKKEAVLALEKVIKAYSDKDHYISIPMIQEHMQKEYNIQLDRRTIYSYWDIFDKYNINVTDYSKETKGYAYIHPFTSEEADKIIAAVNKLDISDNAKAKMINLITDELSVYQKEKLQKK